MFCQQVFSSFHLFSHSLFTFSFSFSSLPRLFALHLARPNARNSCIIFYFLFYVRDGHCTHTAFSLRREAWWHRQLACPRIIGDVHKGVEGAGKLNWEGLEGRQASRIDHWRLLINVYPDLADRAVRPSLQQCYLSWFDIDRSKLWLSLIVKYMCFPITQRKSNYVVCKSKCESAGPDDNMARATTTFKQVFYHPWMSPPKLANYILKL